MTSDRDFLDHLAYAITTYGQEVSHSASEGTRYRLRGGFVDIIEHLNRVGFGDRNLVDIINGLRELEKRGIYVTT
ncbi:MAG: hypothetical protein QXY45_02000 [Candidatus Aenigmatarchaeota archaeon]